MYSFISLRTSAFSSISRVWLFASLWKSRSTISASSWARSSLPAAVTWRTARSSWESLRAAKLPAWNWMLRSASTTLPFKAWKPPSSAPSFLSRPSTAAMQCWCRSLPLATASLVASCSRSALARASASLAISTWAFVIQLFILPCVVRISSRSLSTLLRLPVFSSTFESVRARSLARCSTCCWRSRTCSVTGCMAARTWCWMKLCMDSSPPFLLSSTMGP
mmetsp:Transcript_96309/g.272308  ORF Transcript_96309/g.272308 Transcript_96309/m.272308 type:complete len:221 (+) Transcript_96309:534-1196(+)